MRPDRQAQIDDFLVELTTIVVDNCTNNHSTTSSIPDTAVYPTHTAVPELPGSEFGLQWKQHACAARDLAKSGQGYWDPVERQVQQ